MYQENRCKRWMSRFMRIGLTAMLAFVPEMAFANETSQPDAKPYIQKSTKRTMVPVRFVSERLGASVNWEASEKRVTIGHEGKRITLYANDYKASVNQHTILLDAKAMIRQQRVFVPLRFISETFGAKVDWVSAEKLVVISAEEKEIKLKIDRFEEEWTGKYIGQADPHTIEVDTSEGAHAYQLSSEWMDSFVPPEENSWVRIKFYKDGENRRILTGMEPSEDGYQNERFKHVSLEKSGDRYTVKGEARVFEGVFHYVVEDGHYQLIKGFAKAAKGAPEWSPFQFTIDAQKIRESSTLMLILYEESPKDGSSVQELLIPLD